MSKYILILIALISIMSCQMKVEPMIDANLDECEHCTMIIQDIDHGAVLIDSEENLHTYCSPVCMILEKKKYQASGSTVPISKYLFDHISKTAIPVLKAIIVHGDFHTAMGHGLLAFADKSEAENFASEVNGVLMSWDDLRINHESPDVKIELSEESQNIEVKKNDLILVNYNNSDSDTALISLLGYDFSMSVEPGVERSALFVATKPGQGFMFQKNGTVNLATLFVVGEHTAEEAIYK